MSTLPHGSHLVHLDTLLLAPTLAIHLQYPDLVDAYSLFLLHDEDVAVLVEEVLTQETTAIVGILIYDLAVILERLCNSCVPSFPLFYLFHHVDDFINIALNH